MSRAGWRHAWARVRSDWPGKVAAVLAACVLWWVASNDPGTTAQRSLLVPLQVVGADADEVTVGVPARVEVVIAGPGERMDRLDAGDVDAVLDLAGVDGEFARDVDARVPQALRVVRVVPAEVIGRLEAVRSVQLPVRATAALPEGDRVPVALTVDPTVVSVEARDPVLAQVTDVLAFLPETESGERDVVLVPVDADGVPVPEARVVPARATVRVALETRLATVTRPVAVAAPTLPGVSVESVRPAELELIGPAGALDALSVVSGRVPDATSSLLTGRYDLPVRLELPAGVAARDQVIATVRVQAVVPSEDGRPVPTP